MKKLEKIPGPNIWRIEIDKTRLIHHGSAPMPIRPKNLHSRGMEALCYDVGCCEWIQDARAFTSHCLHESLCFVLLGRLHFVRRQESTRHLNIPVVTNFSSPPFFHFFSCLVFSPLPSN